MLKVSPGDVFGVLQNSMPYFKGCLITLGVLFALLIAAHWIKKPARALVRKLSVLAMLLALVITVNLVVRGPMIMLATLLSAEGGLSDETFQSGSGLCVELAEEGIVLEQNEENLLPLPAGSNLNVFGWASVSPVYGGTGSGALSDNMAKIDLLTGLQDAGLHTNRDLSAFYASYCAQRPELGYGVHNWTLPEPAAKRYPGSLISGAKDFSDTALIVLSRIGGEFADLPTDMAVTRMQGLPEHYTENDESYQDFPDGTHYLTLSQSERDMVELVCANFEKVIVVYNGANTLELGFVNRYPQIKSVLWCPGPGQTGFDALGKILTGVVNPSGHNTDTFVYDLTRTPWFQNFGNFSYDNADELGYVTVGPFGTTSTIPHFVNYTDGIYVGYRFYETAAAEGAIQYEDYVQYPFGHGLSYTTFTQTMGEPQLQGNKIQFPVTVTNTGSIPGKDVVQVYSNPPYTNGGIEKSAANLITFAKTELVAPGESQTITISFAQDELASFDAHKYGCYVLEQGDYMLSVNANSHTVLDSKVYSVPEDIVYTGNQPRSSDLAAAVTSFAFAEGEIPYLSRADGFANLQEAIARPKSYSMTDACKATFTNTENWNPEDYNDPNDPMPSFGVQNGLKLKDLRGADFNDPRWEKLLDQMSVRDMDLLIAYGGYGTMKINSIQKVAVNDNDGPANILNNFTGLASIGFPSEVMIACTWNETLAEAFGDSIGTMADEMDVSGWYAPAMDNHRSAFDGRNFEYYSEDGVLAGKIGAASIRGARAHGITTFMKHYVLNDQQAAQAEMLCTWVSEQALREIYLKPFELSVKEGGSNGVMAAWNYVGNQWCGASSPLLQTVLRDEWGFQGVVITDGYHFVGFMDADRAIRNGCDLMLKNFDVGTNHLSDQKSATGLLAMRRAVKNILFVVVNSRAYAPDNLDTGMLKWEKTLLLLNAVSGVFILGLGALSVRTYRRKKRSIFATQG